MKRVTETISPERAKEILSCSAMKNPINRKKVERFKAMILQGKWDPQHSMFIKIRKGKLMDGHHRMTAIEESGITIDIRIQYD